MTGPKILVVDDEPNIRDLLTAGLRFQGFAVRAVGNGAAAISAVLAEEPDLIVLDVMLPDMNGFSVTKRLRASGYTSPILFVTAKDDTQDKITGLTVGGDDYVTKPFSPREIVARVRAVLRRARPVVTAAPPAAPSGLPLQVDDATRRATALGKSLELTRVEFDLLSCLLSAPGRVFTRAQLIDRVWGDGFAITDRTIDSHVKALRRKVADAGADANLIETVRGVGYRVSDDPTT